RISVDHQHLPVPAVLAELRRETFGLGVFQLEAVDHHETVLRLARQRHLEAKRADLFVERDVEIAPAGTMGLAAADEDRRLAIAMTSRAATLLPAVLLAGAGDIRALARRAGGAAAVL